MSPFAGCGHAAAGLGGRGVGSGAGEGAVEVNGDVNLFADRFPSARVGYSTVADLIVN